MCRHARLVTRIGFEDVATVVHGIAELGDRHLCRDLARCVPPHAVGYHEEGQLLVDEEVVLVVGALAPDIRCGPEAEIHRCSLTAAAGRVHQLNYTD